MTDPFPAASRAERAAALGGLLLAALAAWLSLRLIAPPAPLPETAADADFSAARAMAHVRALAAQPRPLGSAAHARARVYLEAELARVGLEPQVQTTTAVRYFRGSLRAARVSNVLTRVAGSEGGSPLLLVSHYDSVASGPGAGDDAAGVAAMLETLRALLAGPPPAGDLIALFTDGEELGLLGAAAFVDEHPWASEIGAVLNFEARGNSGVVTMFETGAGNGRLVRELAAASWPFASSLSQEVYKRMPNSTDFTVFRDAGFNGLNFAFIGNHPAYHSALDTAAALDRRSLQQMGSAALALSRRLAGVDPAALAAPDAVYFNPLGFRLLVYSQTTGRALAILAAAVLAALLLAGARRGAIALAEARRGALAMLGCLLLGPLAARGCWALFARFFPRALETPWGEPWSAGKVLLAFLLVDLAAAGGVLWLVEGRRPRSLFAGALVPWAAVAVALAFLVPGGGYLALGPLLVGVLALGAVLALPDTADAAQLLVLSAATVAGAVLFAPIVRLISQALGAGNAALMALLLALPVTLGLANLAAIDRGRLRVTAIAAAGGLALLAWAGVEDAPGPERPRPSSLFYLLDAERGDARWLSADPRVDEWNGQALPGGAEPAPAPDPLPALIDGPLLQGPAPLLEVPSPTATLVADERDERRVIDFLVSSPRGAPAVHLTPEIDLAIVEAVAIEGRRHEIPSDDGPLRVSIFGLPAEGIEVRLELSGVQPVALGLLDQSYGLPGLPGLTIAPRPPHLIPRISWATDTTGVYRVVWL